MAVKVVFKIGHSSTLKEKKSSNGYTHDWNLYVQGQNKDDISQFVEKVVFHLHESFPRPKRVCKEPPYSVAESGYAGFTVFVDIYFRCREEPRKAQFTYDMDLQQSGPPQHRSEEKPYIFEEPSSDFRKKLLRGGGVPVSAGGTTEFHKKEHASVRDKPNIGGTDSNSGKKHKHSPRDGAKSNDLLSKLFSESPVLQHGKTNSKTSSELKEKKDGQSKRAESKERSSNRERDKAAPAEKSNESRSDVKDRDKHKSSQSSVNKEKDSKKSTVSNGDGHRHEKKSRDDDKARKDRPRDKAHDKPKEKEKAYPLKRSLSPPMGESVPKKSTGAKTSGLVRLHDAKSKSDKTGNSKSKHSSSSSSSRSKKENKSRDSGHERERDHNKPKPSGDEKSKKVVSQSNKSPGIVAAAAKLTPVKAVGRETIQVLANSAQQSTPKSTNGKENSSSNSKHSTSSNSGEKDKEKKGHRHKKSDRSKDKEKERSKEQQLSGRHKEDQDMAIKTSKSTPPSNGKDSLGKNSSADTNGSRNGTGSSGKKDQHRRGKVDKSERRISVSAADSSDSKKNISSSSAATSNNTSSNDVAITDQSATSVQSQLTNSRLKSSPQQPVNGNNLSSEVLVNESSSPSKTDNFDSEANSKRNRKRRSTGSEFEEKFSDCAEPPNKLTNRGPAFSTAQNDNSQCSDASHVGSPPPANYLNDAEHARLCNEHEFSEDKKTYIASLDIEVYPHTPLTDEQARWLILLKQLHGKINETRDLETRKKVIDIVREAGPHKWLKRLFHFDLLPLSRQILLELMEVYGMSP